jgi:hypothetical protein
MKTPKYSFKSQQQFGIPIRCEFEQSLCQYMIHINIEEYILIEPDFAQIFRILSSDDMPMSIKV